MKKDILDFWPFPFEPRQNQIKALNWLANSNAKYKLLEAPIGSGKSALAITYSLYNSNQSNRSTNNKGDSYILTPQRILQQQYETSMAGIDAIDLQSIYGRNNYTCVNKGTNCSTGSLIKPRCKVCSYQVVKSAGLKAANTVMNYKLGSLLFQFGGEQVKPRRLIIMDECHNIEDVLIAFDSVKITHERCKKYKIQFKNHISVLSAKKWITQYYISAISDVLLQTQEEVEPLFDKSGDEITKADIKRLKEYNTLIEHVDEVHGLILRNDKYLTDNFVLSYDPKMFEFKRLYGAYSFNKIIKPMGKEFLFMSSTILNKIGFCNDLELPKNDTDFLSLSSEFPRNNRPIFYMPQMKMNATWNNTENKSNRTSYIKNINQILKLHETDSGIIHTGNFKVAEWLCSELTKNKKLTHNIHHHNPESGDNRNNVITAFIEDTKPSILISPSSTEGLDLKDDLARFAIIVKVGFGYLGDQWIKKRMELSTAWYQRKALIDCIQGSGRIVRSEQDWGVIYIMDESFGFLRNAASHLIPKWWNDSIEFKQIK